MTGGHRPGVIVQARMGSTRLPGKVLLSLQGDSLLGHLLRRLRRLRTTPIVVVATTTLDRDRVIEREAHRHGVATFAGSEHDVLRRYVEAARRYGIDPVVRVTSDCPLADPAVIDAAIGRYLGRRASGAALDIVTNTRDGHRTYPRGLDVEVVSLAVLERLDAMLPDDHPDREHVTRHAYRNPERFTIDDLELPRYLSQHRWTVDTAEDLELIRRIYDRLYPTDPTFDMAAILTLLTTHPELASINAHIPQK